MASRIENELRALRRERGDSQARMAALAGISRQSYAAIEAGEAVPSTEVALRLAAALGRAVEEIFRLPAREPATVRARWAGGAPARGRVRLSRVAGRLLAHPPAEGERPARRADGVVLASDGGSVEVRLLPDRPPEPSLVVLGCDPAFGILAEVLRVRGVEVLWSQRGSRAALEALARGEAHVAGTHLRDPETGEYNAPSTLRLLPFACTRISFASWEQGLLLRGGNPLGVERVEDLPRPGLRFLNREPGSGSRALLDDRIGAAGIAAETIPGYMDTSASGHLAVAEAIASGLADAGVAIRAAGEMFGLAVAPLAWERYDLVVPDHFLDLPAVGTLLDALRRPGVRAQVEALGGYDAASMGR